MAWLGRFGILILLFLAMSMMPIFSQAVPPKISLNPPPSPPGQVPLISPHLASDWAKPQAVMRRLKELAGRDAVNCGRARGYQDSNFRTDCALDAFAAKQPFFVQYEMPAWDTLDAEVTIGFVAQNPNNVLALVQIRRDGWFPPTGEHLATRPCPAPVNLVKTANGRLNCFPPHSDTTADIFSFSWY